MATDRTLWYPLSRPVRRSLADLVGVVLLAVVTGGVVLSSVADGTALRILLGLPLALFLPGYALVAALFPGTADRTREDTNDAGGREATWLPRPGEGIDGLDRIVLSLGLSAVVTPLTGFVLNYTPWGIRPVPVVASLAGFVVVASVVAALRRWNLPADDRFSVSYRAWIASVNAALFRPETRLDAVLNVVLVVSLLLAAGSVGWAVAVPRQGEEFTELYLLTERENGTLVADGYPKEFVRGESRPLVVGIGNHEGEPMSYSVVVELQRVRTESGGVLEERTLHRFRASVDAGGSRREQISVRPTMTGTRLRLAVLLYEGDVPADPSTANAARDAHLWINVTAPGSG